MAPGFKVAAPARPGFLRPHIGSAGLAALTALALTLVYNNRFWSELIRLRAPLDARDVIFLGSVSLILFSTLNLLLTAFAWPWLQKPITVLMLIASTLVGHFMASYGVVIDSTMMQNVFESDPGEVRELIGGSLIARLLLLGAIPSLLVLAVRIRRRPWLGELKRKLAVVAGSLAALLLLTGVMYADYASFFPDHRVLGQLATPINALYATQKFLRKSARPAAGTIEPLGLDATLSAAALRRKRPTLIVLVVGETARAEQFSLNCYWRETDPVLSREPVISFADVSACGTSTAISLPCMFSPLGRAGYDSRAARGQEGLLDVLKHAGVQVLWRDNNSGCKGTCDRVEYERSPVFAAPELCRSGECFDEALLSGLDERIDRFDGPTVIVLHQQGSHGPAYHKRYPDSFRRFLPDCVVAELQACTPDEVVNAYDNTILYTDWFLGQVLDLLRRHDERFDAAMLYVSDHGESLGDGNLYLHGLPYAIAPEQQRKVPMILWISPGLEAAAGLARSCLEQARETPLSHDNLFHSVLGLMSVKTSVYTPRLDLFAACRNAPAASDRPAALGSSQPSFSTNISRIHTTAR